MLLELLCKLKKKKAAEEKKIHDRENVRHCVELVWEAKEIGREIREKNTIDVSAEVCP